MKWKIGNVEIKNQVGLAPMAGISNPAYMKIVEKMNAGFAVTELISSEAIIRNNKKTFEMLNGIDEINMPVAIQIFGSDPETMAKSAKILCDKFPKIAFIDINMGCPVSKVVKANAGSALLKNPKKAYDIVLAVKENIDIPVTVKIRSGWDSDSINAKEIAKKVESAGASAIFIHPRTRSQGYSGKADWDIIRQVKESVSIPVIGNGDIKSCYSAKKMIFKTNCDAVMIGRAALGNPWIIKECVEYLENGKEIQKITETEKFDMISLHLNNLKKYKNDTVALLEIRSHIAWYLKGIPNSNDLKRNIFQANTISDVENLLEEFKKKEEIKCIIED